VWLSFRVSVVDLVVGNAWCRDCSSSYSVVFFVILIGRFELTHQPSSGGAASSCWYWFDPRDGFFETKVQH
jgi:hypothetical protein